MKRGDFLKMMLGLPFGIGTFAARNLQTSGRRQQHYLLNKFYVARFQYYDGPSMIENIHHGESLLLAAYPGSTYDKFAVKIIRNGTMIGHVPRSDNKHISRLLQQHINLHCEVVESNPERETWKMLKVHLYL